MLTATLLGFSKRTPLLFSPIKTASQAPDRPGKNIKDQSCEDKPYARHRSKSKFKVEASYSEHNPARHTAKSEYGWSSQVREMQSGVRKGTVKNTKKQINDNSMNGAA